MGDTKADDSKDAKVDYNKDTKADYNKDGASKDMAAKPASSTASATTTPAAADSTAPQTDRRPGFCARRVGSKKSAIKAKRCKKLNVKKKCPALVCWLLDLLF